MCGILAFLEEARAGERDTATSPAAGSGGGLAVTRARALDLARRLRHRGPDWSGVWSSTVRPQALLLHERLAICGVASGAQPLFLHDDATGAVRAVLAVNGEIYNDKELRSLVEPHAVFETESDCEVILHLYAKFGIEKTLGLLRGMFAFVLYDVQRRVWFAARDAVGIVPLYWGRKTAPGIANSIFASEMKAIVDEAEVLGEFPPGHFVRSTDAQSAGADTAEPQFRRFYEPGWFLTSSPILTTKTRPTPSAVQTELRARFTRSVHSHLMGDVPYGVLLSGGLDSSLVAAIAAKFVHGRVDDMYRGGASSPGTASPPPSEAPPAAPGEAWWPRLHTFAVGLKDSPDLAAARAVAEHIGSVHHETIFTIQQGMDSISDVIYHLETYDVTTVRASVPMFLLARTIRAFGVKMVLSGEGADEIFGGYLYFHKAPSAAAFREESVRKVQQLHSYDCLRANKAMLSFGVEARVPFLDRDFLDWTMDPSTVPTEYKMSEKAATGAVPQQKHRAIEKWLLRSAFDDGSLLPDSVLWRQKEQFSDGVGYGWIDALKDTVSTSVSDEQMGDAATRFPTHPPRSKEEFAYREIFEKHFGSRSDAAKTIPSQKSSACSTEAALKWDASLRADPSGRSVIGVHDDAIVEE